MLDGLKNDSNKDKVGDLYIQAGKVFAEKKDFPQAIQTVKKVPSDAKQTKQAQILIAQWEKAATAGDEPDPKDKPKEKKGPRGRKRR